MSNPDFRALCAELVDAIDSGISTDRMHLSPVMLRARASLAQLEPVEPVWAEIHYAWELEDADGEWQAGGSANSLDDVQREGDRYLQTYAQDGPHKLIIQRHCVITIKEVTND
jgi:hypothetical protein